MARKILLADDSVTAQNMGRKILTDAGYEVVTVNNGSAALKKISECKPAVVVLDVYMPGYSGLEVCARIKEGRDTEGIPVLLTVGKLEPFRQEEARKVHADAFIIKPFEASELLSALNKLEAKSGNHHSEPAAAVDVPKPAAESKSCKHVAATMARYEREVADGAPKFGDHESGWKARLTMPAPGSKHEESEEEPEIATISSRPREWNNELADRPAFSVTPVAADTTSALHGLPGDVTPAELAAIAAAAAAVGGANGDVEVASPASKEAAPANQPDTQVSPITFASEAQEQEPAAAAPIANGSAGPVAAQVEAVFTSFAATHATAGTETEKAVTAPARETIAAVAPPESKVVAMSVRWVAEEVPVGPAESALVLEQEMQKAFAAFAAAENGNSYQPGPVNGAEASKLATIATPEISTPAAFSEPVKPVEEQEAAITSAAVQTPEPTFSSQSASAVSEPVKPPITHFSPVSTEELKHAVVAFGEPHPFSATEPEDKASTNVEPTFESTPDDAASTVSTGATLADDWHDLRQPIAKADTSADKSTGNFEDFRSDKNSADRAEVESKLESAMAAAASGDSSSSSSTDSALSNIVDNMLAELKPKLMAELAKKLDKK